MNQLRPQHGGIGNVGHDHDNAADPAIFSADRAEIDGGLTAYAISTNQRHIEVIDLLTACYRSHRIVERGSPRWDAQGLERMPQNLVLKEAKTAPAAVGVADDPFRVGHQNQTLRVAENFAGKVAFFLKLSLGLPQASDIQN